jgi:spore germination protein KC
LTGTAVFKNLKLVGYLNPEHTQLMLWVTGKLKNGTMRVNLPKDKGSVSVKLVKTDQKIVPSVKGGKVKFAIHLKGKGTLEENNGKLDYANPKNLQIVENALEQELRQNTLKMITEVQKKYNSDIFGFGEVLHKKNKKAWQKLRLEWDDAFAQAEFTVDADFVVIRAGMTGPPLQLREKEIIK